MQYTKRIPVVLLLLVASINYQITADRNSLPSDILSSLANDTHYSTDQPHTIHSLFPYKMYHHTSPNDSHSLAKSYLFIKTAVE